MGPKSGNSITTSGRPRRRAVEACSFCRRRKVVTTVSSQKVKRVEADISHQIKCNNEQPTCANCKTYGKDCIYEPLASPADNTLASTPTRRHAGRQKRGKSSGTRPETHTPATAREGSTAGNSPAEQNGNAPPQTPGDHQQPETPADQTRSRRGDVSRIVVSANGVSSYHGRTSALYEESLQERSSIADLRPRMPDEWIEKGLIAEAAKQRRLLASPLPDPRTFRH